MTEKVFIEKKCHDVYEYVGKCPRCQIPQQNQFEQNVNVLCKNCCINSIETIILNNQHETPEIGSIVFDITKLNTQTRSYFHITLITPDMKVMIIEAEYKYTLSEKIPHLIERYTPVEEKCIEDNLITRIWKNLLK